MYHTIIAIVYGLQHCAQLWRSGNIAEHVILNLALEFRFLWCLGLDVVLYFCTSSKAVARRSPCVMVIGQRWSGGKHIAAIRDNYIDSYILNTGCNHCYWYWYWYHDYFTWNTSFSDSVRMCLAVFSYQCSFLIVRFIKLTSKVSRTTKRINIFLAVGRSSSSETPRLSDVWTFSKIQCVQKTLKFDEVVFGPRVAVRKISPSKSRLPHSLLCVSTSQDGGQFRFEFWDEDDVIVANRVINKSVDIMGH